MLTEKIARRPMTIGAVALKPGDVVTDEVESLLPPGRVKTLMDQGWISERPVSGMAGLDRLEALLDEQVARADALEERIAALEARRGPGRPRKVEE